MAEKNVFETTYTLNGSQEKIKVIAKENQTFCKPNLKENPNAIGAYPHMFTDSRNNHFDIFTPAGKIIAYDQISGTSVTITDQNITVGNFPYLDDLKVFSAQANCTVVAEISGGLIILRAIPSGPYWLCGRRLIE